MIITPKISPRFGTLEVLMTYIKLCEFFTGEIEMKLKYIVCIFGLGAVLAGCGGVGGLPEASTVNCAGRGMELALQEFNERGTEAERQAFVDGCNALANK